MKILHINILDKKATYLNRDGDIVCGNSNYLIEFAFDAEWDEYEEKTARFIWNDQYQDVKFVGTACYVPIISHTTELKVGVYAGELSTTTSATIPCNKSILCENALQGGTIIVDGDSVVGAILPIPSDKDNGKVLTAEDCKAVWKPPAGGSDDGGLSAEVYTQDDFLLGLWHRQDRKSKTFYDGMNIGDEQSPAIVSRTPRRRWFNLSETVKGVHCSNAFYLACDEELIMSISENRVQVLGVVSSEEKIIGTLGKSLLVLPDCKVYDSQKEMLQSKAVKLTISNPIIQNGKTLYSAAHDFTQYFEVGDAVRIVSLIGSTYTPNTYHTIRGVEKNSLHFDDNSFTTSNISSMYVMLDVPAVKGLCTALNRLWGYSGNTIYVSAADHIFRWYRYDGDSESSYTAIIPSEKKILGCMEYSGRPIFFTANSIIRVDGDSPANFSLVETSMYGLKADSPTTPCIVGGNMLYLSDAGVVSSDGVTATVISEALGQNLASGIATSDGRHYYLSAVDEQGIRALYVYDSVTGAWIKEDGDNIMYLCYFNGDVYAVCSNNVVYIIGEDRTGHGSLLKTKDSFVEFHPLMHPSYIEIKPTNISLQVECQPESELTLSVRYDDGEWEECGKLQTEGSSIWSIPLEERTCRSLGIRLDAVGSYKVSYITAQYLADVQSDLPPIRVEDEGKGLTVEDGTAVWKEPAVGNGLPEVTANDNGKCLQVVDGKWVAVALQDICQGGM